MNKVLVKYCNIQGALRTADIIYRNKTKFTCISINESYKTFTECKRYSTKSELGKTVSCHSQLYQTELRFGLHRQCVRLKLGTNRSLCTGQAKNACPVKDNTVSVRLSEHTFWQGLLSLCCEKVDTLPGYGIKSCSYQTILIKQHALPTVH